MTELLDLDQFYPLKKAGDTDLQSYTDRIVYYPPEVA